MSVWHSVLFRSPIGFRQITSGKPLPKKKDGRKRFFAKGSDNSVRWQESDRLWGVCVCVWGGGGGAVGGGWNSNGKPSQLNFELLGPCKKNCRSLPTLKGLHTPSVM